MNRQSLKGLSDLLILSALAVRPMHGYALTEYLRTHTDERFVFGAGMIYPLLHKLEKKKLIRSEWKEFAGSNRRIYSLTKQGKKMLEAKRREWHTFSRLMTKIIMQPSQ